MYYAQMKNTVKAKDDSFGAMTPDDLYAALSGIWCEYTCAPRMRKDWSTENKTLGQCSVTAFLAQDIFGGDVYGIPLPDGSYHCFNRVEDKIFDLTSEQFPEALDYTNCVLQSRDTHFSKEEKRQRYIPLKEALLKKNG